MDFQMWEKNIIESQVYTAPDGHLHEQNHFQPKLLRRYKFKKEFSWLYNKCFTDW